MPLESVASIAGIPLNQAKTEDTVMKELLEEIIEAGKDAKLPLNMTTFYCGTSCCLCGDVAVKRRNDKEADSRFERYEILQLARGFSDQLDESCEDLFGNCLVSESIWQECDVIRRANAASSGIFTEEELNHPHLTTDHNDREIAHDYVRLVIKKVEATGEAMRFAQSVMAEKGVYKETDDPFIAYGQLNQKAIDQSERMAREKLVKAFGILEDE